jgi:hypothetical protein
MQDTAGGLGVRHDTGCAASMPGGLPTPCDSSKPQIRSITSQPTASTFKLKPVVADQQLSILVVKPKYGLSIHLPVISRGLPHLGGPSCHILCGAGSLAHMQTAAGDSYQRYHQMPVHMHDTLPVHRLCRLSLHHPYVAHK